MGGENTHFELDLGCLPHLSRLCHHTQVLSNIPQEDLSLVLSQKRPEASSNAAVIAPGGLEAPKHQTHTHASAQIMSRSQKEDLVSMV